HRLAGHAAAPPGDAPGSGQRLRAAAVDRRSRAAAAQPGQDSAQEVARRMAKAADEMSHWAEYDYISVNRDIDDSVDRVRAILAAERMRRERQIGLPEFVAALRAGR